MWVNIKNALYNLNHVIMISVSKSLDEAGVPEMSQKPCIQLHSSPDTIAKIEFESNGELISALKDIMSRMGLTWQPNDFDHPFGYTGYDIFKKVRI